MRKYLNSRTVLLGFAILVFSNGNDGFAQTVPAKKASHPWELQLNEVNSGTKDPVGETIKIESPAAKSAEDYFSMTASELIAPAKTASTNADANIKSQAMIEASTPIHSNRAEVKFIQDDEPTSVVQDSTAVASQDQQQQSAELAFGDWPVKSIREVGIDIRDTSEKLPQDYSFQLVDSSSVTWESFAASSKIFAWAAPNIRYQPLYFEDIALERYGQTYCGFRQWARSAAHFGTSATLLPYKMYFDPPRSCDYPLGFCRPGNCTPSVSQRHWYGFYRNW